MEGLLHTYDCEEGDSGKEYTMRVIQDIVREKQAQLHATQKELDALCELRLQDVYTVSKDKVKTLQKQIVALQQASRFIARQRKYA